MLTGPSFPHAGLPSSRPHLVKFMGTLEGSFGALLFGNVLLGDFGEQV